MLELASNLDMLDVQMRVIGTHLENNAIEHRETMRH